LNSNRSGGILVRPRTIVEGGRVFDEDGAGYAGSSYSRRRSQLGF
jgi:hypothetical protein